MEDIWAQAAGAGWGAAFRCPCHCDASVGLRALRSADDSKQGEEDEETVSGRREPSAGAAYTASTHYSVIP